MPRVMRTGGVNLTDDVVKIRDVAPARPAPRPKTKPIAEPAEGEAPDPELEAIEAEPTEADFEPADFSAPAPAAVSEGLGGDAVREEIIQSAMAEAGRILEGAVREGEQKKAELLAGIEAEAEELRRQAVEQGRQEGFATVADDVKNTAGEIQAAIARFEGERAGFEAEYEEQLRWMAIEIASKVLAKKVSDDDAVMADMVDKAVQSVQSEPWIRVEVAQEMQRLIDRLTQLYDGQPGIDVSAIPAPAGTVHIETPSGVVDASLRTQLGNLKDYFNQV